VRIEPFDPATESAKVQACYELYSAGQRLDDPGGPVMSRRAYSGWFSLGWTGATPREAWLVPATDGGATAACLLELPTMENTHVAVLTITVAPDQRRAGLGSTLLRHAAARARELGRPVLSCEARQDSPGSAFAAAMGARVCVTDVRRVLELSSIRAGHLAALRQQADRAAAGYSLVQWAGPCPEEYVDQVAAVSNALEDAPRAPGIHPEYLTARRVRQLEHRLGVQGLHYYSVAARCDRNGDLAALSQLAVDPAGTGWGFQDITAVPRPHRGHRLGLLVKLAMLDLLATAEPGLDRILTGNAGTNHHMIAINAELGFRVLSHWPTWELDVAQVS
jgi:GNAT superfamily N-acetyltransferase